MGEFRRCHQDINEREQLWQAIVNTVDVSGNNRARGTRGFGHTNTGRWIVSVEMQYPPPRSQRYRSIFRCIRDTLIAVPDDRPLAVARIDDDESDLIASAFNHFCEFTIDSLILQCAETKLSFG